MSPTTTRPDSPGQSSFCHPRPAEELDVDLLLRSLAHPCRREVLCFLDAEPEWTRRDLATNLGSVVAVPGIQTEEEADLALYHWHLPLLEEAGLVAADDEFRRVERGDDFELVREMVDAAVAVTL